MASLADLFVKDQNTNLKDDPDYLEYLRRKQREDSDIINKGLDAGKAWEDISADSGIPLEEVQKFSQATRPDYGAKPDNGLFGLKKVGRNIGDSGGQAAGDATLDDARNRILGMLRDPNITPERRAVLFRYLGEEGITAPQEAAQNTQDVKEITNLPKNLGRAVAAPFNYVAEGTARALGAGDETEGQQAANRNLEGAQQRILAMLNDPDVPEARKEIIRSVLNQQNVEATKEAAANTEEVERATNKRRFAASAYEVGLTPFAFGRSPLAGTKGFVAENAAYGTLGATSQEDLSPGSLAFGAVSGMAIPAIAQATKAGQKFLKSADKKELFNLITDESRLLPEQASAGADVAPRSRQLSTGSADPNLAVRTSADPALIKRLDEIDTQIRTAQQTSNITADEARALVRERKTVLSQIQNPSPPPPSGGVSTPGAGGVSDSAGQAINRISEIDEQLVNTKSLSTERAAALAVERQSLVASLPPDGRKLADSATQVSKTALNSDESISTLAEKTEYNAIAKKLTEGFDDLSTYEKVSFTQQAETATKLASDNYDQAVRIATGVEQSPDGLLPGAVYRAVEAKAFREGDVATIEQLTKSPLASRASRQGQEIGILGFKDPDSPVDAIKQINTLREAARKRGIDIPPTVNSDEATEIVNLARNAESKKQVWLDNGGNIDDPQRLEFGRAQVEMRNYVNRLKLEASKLGIKEQLKHPVQLVGKVAGNTKALQSSMDNSAIFRQGWKTLWTHPGKWAKNGLKTFQDIVKTFGGKNTLDEVAADIASRPNAELYKKGRLAVGIDEEAYPEHLGEKVPLLGRAYKASEAAYVGFLQRQRADIFDKYIQVAQKTGVELTDKEVKSIGGLVNSLTSRGSLGKLEPVGDVLNNVFFSPRLLASHFQVLGGHVVTGAGGSNFVRKQAAKNLLKIISGTATVLAVADIARPGSVEWDPRSSDFGKIRIGNTRFDVTGGMGSVLTLASRWATQSKKSSTTGDITRLTEKGFGKQNLGDVTIDFFENKFSPVAGIIRDLSRGEDFNGNKPTPVTILKNLGVPLIFQNMGELKQPGAADSVLSLIAEGLGISANTYSPSPNWKSSDSKELQAFKKKVGEDKFNQAYDKFNQQYNDWYINAEKNPRFQRLSNDDRQTVRQNKAEELRDRILEQYNFEYKTEKKDKNRLKGF